MDDFRNRIIDCAEKSGQLLNASIELTTACNFQCKHCYIRGLPDRKCSFLDLQQYFEYLDELKSLGCLFLTLTGGEPFLHPCFCEMYCKAKEKGFLVSVFTNLSLINERLVTLFSERKPYKIEATLYGADAGTYRLFTGTDAWECVYSGLESLHSHRINLSLKATLTTDNYLYLSNFEDIARIFNAPFRYDPYICEINPVRSIDVISNCRLSPKQIANIILADSRFRKAIVDRLSKPCDYVYMYRCHPGKNNIYITADNRALICPFAQEHSVNLTTSSISEAVRKIRELGCSPFPTDSRCFGCRMIEICRYCPSRFYNETGSYVAPPEWVCQTARLLYDGLCGDLMQ